MNSTEKLSYVAFGSNLKTVSYPDPAATVTQAIAQVAMHQQIRHKNTARYYETAPVPKSDQRWYVNTVAAYSTDLDAQTFLRWCHLVEDNMGRQRSVANAARVIDIDLIDFKGEVVGTGGDKTKQMIVPHPAMQVRGFVLLPLFDLNPNWLDPRNQKHINELIADLAPDEVLGDSIRLL